MANLKFHSKEHRERSQLKSRSKLGLLEKHKDYVLRARDYNLKKKRLTNLKQKVINRNPDEFYFGMISSKTKGGLHIKERNEKYDGDVLKILKTQDHKYISMQRNKETLKIQRLEQQIIPTFEGDHTLFVEDPEADIDTSKGPVILKGQEKQTMKMAKELASRKQRESKLKIAENELLIQRQLMSKGKRQKAGETESGLPIIKWKSIRKK